MGNKGLGARLLYEMQEPGVDPLSPRNHLIVTTAPMTGTGAPSTNRFNVTTRSPLTGAIVCSNSGGDFGVHLKRAGYDALIVKGKAKSPVWLRIGEDEVSVEDAGELWGLDTEKTREKLPPKTGKLVIGPAGENLVKYACIVSQERVAGRAGVGTVMGSKNLKAVVAGGNMKPRPAHEEEYKKACKAWREVLKNHPTTGGELPSYGTAMFINRCNAANAIPTRNFSMGTFPYADEVSGETLAETRLEKNYACYGCVIACGRRVKVGGKSVKGPEYETLALLGPNLENRDLEAIIEWNYQADLLGLDTISMANTLGFVMELAEKGLIPSDLRFGKTAGISQAIEDIAYRRGLGEDMAEGVRYLAGKYGGEDFAIHSKGLELPGYEPRGAVGHGLGYAVANRGGCHLSGGYVVYVEANGPILVDPVTTTGKAGLVILLQTLLESISTLGCCNFTVFTMLLPKLLEWNARYTPVAKSLSMSFQYSGDLLGWALSTLPPWLLPFKPPFIMFPQVKSHSLCTGSDMTMGKFLQLGQRSYNIERLFNVREGFGSSEDTLPKRLTEELQRAEEPRSRVPLDKLLPRYYRLRGWDAGGRPKKKLLDRLSIREV